MKHQRSLLLLARFVTVLGLALSLWLGPLQASPANAQAPIPVGPIEVHMNRATPFTGDLRNLPQTPPAKIERPEHEDPASTPVLLGSGPAVPLGPGQPPAPSAPAPSPSITFDGLDFANWGAGHPPDPNGDVGPTYYIQVINTSIGIYNKSTGTRVAAFTYDAFMSQGAFGNLCDTNNFGDPVVLYDTFEDRWVITDFAFTLDGSGNVINPPGNFQCIAVSRSGDPLSGGWNFYSINTAGGLGDYPKFGIWPDGLYMSANMFDYAAGGNFQGPRVFAFNKFQMYAGAASVQILMFNAPSGDFTLLPSNARLQAGAPPAGTPNYFVSTWNFLNAQAVYKFHVDWTSISLSSFTGPSTSLASTSWPNAAVPNAATPGNALDVLQIRAMVQNQYSNIGGVESLWVAHTVRRANTAGFAAPRWYQIPVTGGTIGPNDIQASTWDPDGANVTYRYMPSLAVDRLGDMAIGYTTSNSTTNPGLKYAGQLVGDPVNTLSQSEQTLFQGTGTQTGNCGGSACIRWGDYSAMTLDPNGCTFWYTNEYYAANGLNYLTRIGAFSYPSCTPLVGGGTLQGTVRRASDSTPVSGATITFGSRTTTTNGSGVYQFTGLSAGVYSSLSASFPGLNTSSASPVTISDGGTTTQNFSLGAASLSGCFVDTTQADFQSGVASNCDLTSSPGNISLSNAPVVDQQNTTLGNSGVGITIATWGGQTFTPAVTGQLTRVDINLFCSGCTGTTPNLTLSLRATAANLPTGADLATATIAGFNDNGAGGYYSAVFASPPTLTSGTKYALVIRPTANPSVGTYALTRSGAAGLGADVYPGGTRVSGATSGTVWSIPLTGGVSTDVGFITYLQTGYASSGDFVSSLKDANPASGYRTDWTSLSWTATTPANTTLRFQVAASGSASGPFNFVGPDGTAGTFFTTSGASLSQFNGFRYLKYKAYLSTTNSTVTPTLNDVTVCFDNVTTTTTLVSSLNPSNYGAAVTFTATVSPIPTGGTVAFKDGGADLSGCSTQALDGSGQATCSTSALDVGTHSMTAVYSGNSDFPGSTSSILSQVVNCITPITVGNTNDSGLGSLRAAVANVCTGGTVNFGGDYTISLASQLTIARNMTVDGSGRSVTLSGANATRVFFVNSGVSFTLNKLTVADGSAAQGAGLYNNGGTVTINSSTFSNNRTTLDGGALANPSGQVTVVNSTFAGNSTVNGNGAAISNQGALAATNSTFAGNNAGVGPDNLYSQGTSTFNNNLLARGPHSNCSFTVTPGGGHNLEDDATCGPAFTTSSTLLPGALGNHGGGTPTIPLQPASAAIDAGDTGSCPALDQRGQPRTDLGCDVGAYEVQLADSPTIVRSLATGQTTTFGPTLAKVAVVDAGSCTSLSITRTNANHPNAGGLANFSTGTYWTITPAPSGCSMTESLRLPAFTFTPNADSKLCRWDLAGSAWDCGLAANSSPVTEILLGGANQNYIERRQVTQFSDWTAATEVGPTPVSVTSFQARSPWLLSLLGIVSLALVGMLVGWRMRRKKN